MSENKKEQIIAAASECFARFGYKKTTLDDIGRIVGLDKASLYHYFDNKEHIFTTVVLNEFRQFFNQLQQDMAEDMDCEKKILTFFEKRIDFFSQQTKIIPQITEEELKRFMDSGMELYSEIEEEEKSYVAKILKNCLKKGSIKECNVERISEFLFALVDGVKQRYMDFTSSDRASTHKEKKMLEDIQIALKIFLKGLK
ncbi:MAG: TetR family transcriptional regulator [Candidatus Lokiarchaeota archaeon]|nr:TetR family transcriptional regulator [Candidatus Lokiarchaeota archaeon]MBD3199022.1 TetR family transcriptional regulator [Candidatus Lokiarchaeota archaeon]